MLFAQTKWQNEMEKLFSCSQSSHMVFMLLLLQTNMKTDEFLEYVEKKSS